MRVNIPPPPETVSQYEKTPKPVIPAKAGIQSSLKRLDDLSRFACTE